MKKTWFITGISSGLGKALAQSVIDKGDFVIGTFRNQYQTDAFNNEYKDKAKAFTLDVTNFSNVKEVIEKIKSQFDNLDVLVNNAGFGFAGSIEETNEQEARDVFEANFFGSLHVTQNVLPIFRKQRSGHIIQISSHGGFKAFAGFGIYNASKFALEGFSEALAQEVSPLGIKVTIVEPGPFRTNFAGNSFKHASKIIEDYNTTSGLFREKIKAIDGIQEGDPNKAAEAIIQITKSEFPPLRLPLGKTAIATLNSKIESVANEIKEFKLLAESCTY
ncbi:oxidoreductase [Flavobacterium aquatile]|uniref:Short-chain dehydrogenase n=1 Tax=Flavobacterium aquatile LMG 4008 = ATCC 11947 TaxID=1453498 RepID=A0A095TX07_9FLAO|nr:oxidoreductase [Flavobacterium aquatile]KGD66913.1 short-chain dehydrogenase [Flavobacterium aquatile LMG 4008 = ATCC 11947]OXA68006.1 short-chain dehydrogenase/reductase [Flavobacterium aquatile LMG 4008 = ATCC 11947]